MGSLISLGSFEGYDLSLRREHGTPAALVAENADPARCRVYSPRLLGAGMLLSNSAIREAYQRAVRAGYGALVTP
jgi:hypothetical protein